MYLPDPQVLNNYADVLVGFALGSEKGIKQGESVLIQIPECAKPFLVPIRNSVLKHGGYPIIHYIPDNISYDFFSLANKDQLSFFPDKLLKGRIDQIDHLIGIIAESNKHELEGIDPQKIMMSQKAMKPYKEWRDAKESAGKFTWTLALYGTEEMAKEANMDLKDYWDQIINAVFLNEKDPIAKWREVSKEISKIKKHLNSLEITSLNIASSGTNLNIGIGPNRKWMGGGGRNIPSFEVFISPDFRQTEGEITFTEPLYVYGNLIKDVYLKFKDGKVVKASASQGEEVLLEMLKVENAYQIGEFSLTDGKISRITKFMGETLYDENVGGKYGNTHIALGSAYKDSYPSDPTSVDPGKWREMGYNESVVHTDIVSTSNRVVTATLSNGSKKIIYSDGSFII